MFLTKRKNCSVKFRFVITKTGEIIKPSGSLSCMKKPMRFILKTINKTKNKWKPMYLNNKPVNTFVEVKFDYTFVMLN